MTATEPEPPPWTADVPAPDVGVVAEDGRYRAELTNYVQKGDRVKDIRVRGPARVTRKEAQKDAAELRLAALKGGGSDPALFNVRARRKELETIKWKEKDLQGLDDKEEEREREAERRRHEEAEKRLREATEAESLARKAAQLEEPEQKFEPVGPNWQKPGSLVRLPRIAGASWLIHEKQDLNGKYRAWLYFNAVTGKYYRQKDSGAGYIQTGTPHNPRDFPMRVRLGSANLSSKQEGKKLCMAVILQDLHKTGFLLKQPLEFLDRPASLIVLCDGLRNSSLAAEFCAKKLHVLLFPKLSARATEWEDFELMDVLRDAVEALDGMLLDSAACLSGCSLAVGLLIGTRLVIGAVGGIRCVVCGPAPVASQKRHRAATSASSSWGVRMVIGGDAHTGANTEERLRVESAGGRIWDPSRWDSIGFELSSCSARPSKLASIEDERERLLLQVARAANPFAVLGVAPADLAEGAAAIRRTFRKRSLVVHPDKVGTDLRQHAVAVFAKLESAASAVEAMLTTDAGASRLLAQIDSANDTGRLVSDPAVAAQLLSVDEGCGAKQAKRASESKFHSSLSHLQSVCPRDVERALRTLEVAVETVVRATTIWAPTEAAEPVRVTRALGCKDLKAPVPLLSASLVTECIELEPGCSVGVAMLSDSLQRLSNEEIAQQLQQHAPSRPRAAALRLALQGASDNSGAAVGAICAFFERDSGTEGGSFASGGSSGTPAAKRLKTASSGSYTGRVRISHILLRWTGLKGEDEFARPGLEAPTRTQANAERELLELLEDMQTGDTKTLAARFKAHVLKHSECASALNVPYADLGWIEQGEAELALEAAAFATPVGGLSDVVVSSRGAHLMYRLA